VTFRLFRLDRASIRLPPNQKLIEYGDHRSATRWPSALFGYGRRKLGPPRHRPRRRTPHAVPGIHRNSVASARLDRLSLPPRGASAVENGARFSPNIAADVPVSRRLPETLRISRLLDPRLALLDAIERIRVKVAAFHGAH